MDIPPTFTRLKSNKKKEPDRPFKPKRDIEHLCAFDETPQSGSRLQVGKYHF